VVDTPGQRAATADTRDRATPAAGHANPLKGAEDQGTLGENGQPPTLGLTLTQGRLGLFAPWVGAVARVVDPAPLLALGAIGVGSLRRLVWPWLAAVADCGPLAHDTRSRQDLPPGAKGAHWVRGPWPTRSARASARRPSPGRTAGGRPRHPIRQGAVMTDNRREAKPMAGAHGRFGGAPSAPCVKTAGCPQWRGGETAFVSLRGGGRCQGEHERWTFWYSHDLDNHGGPWQTGQQCRDFWTPNPYKASAEHPLHVPRSCMAGVKRGPKTGQKI
jgi:hypothetical protein